MGPKVNDCGFKEMTSAWDTCMCPKVNDCRIKEMTSALGYMCGP